MLAFLRALYQRYCDWVEWREHQKGRAVISRVSRMRTLTLDSGALVNPRSEKAVKAIWDDYFNGRDSR